MRMAFGVGIFTLLATSNFAEAQFSQFGGSKCEGVCSCQALECTDFCLPVACSSSNDSCKRRFTQMKRECTSACLRCQGLERLRRR
jgi:hypothetical protein